MPDFSTLPGMVLHDQEPHFSEPWEAQAFALVIGLYEEGAFKWGEWSQTLGEVVGADEGDTPYYQLWLDALLLLATRKRLVTETEISERKSAWQSALLSTPHGQPIELPKGTK